MRIDSKVAWVRERHANAPDRLAVWADGPPPLGDPTTRPIDRSTIAPEERQLRFVALVVDGGPELDPGTPEVRDEADDNEGDTRTGKAPRDENPLIGCARIGLADVAGLS